MIPIYIKQMRTYQITIIYVLLVVLAYMVGFKDGERVTHKKYEKISTGIIF
jgi:hypothetical protein